MNKNLTMAVVGFGLLASFTSCRKPTNSTQLKVNLTATSSSYDAVNLQISEIWVKVTKENTGWFFLKTDGRVINLKKLATGLDTIVASGSVPISEIREVRFVLGDKNSVIKNGVTYPLILNTKLEGNAVSLMVRCPLVKDSEKVLFNVDVQSSISSPSPGNYVLTPAIFLK